MKKVTILILFFASVITASAQMRERLTDKDIIALIEKIEQGRDTFENSLDNNVKSAWYRGPHGEVKIARYLDEFEKNLRSMKERFSKDYSASDEAANVLQQASGIDGFIKGHPITKGGSDWESLSVDLRTLANAYGVEFPLPDGTPVRRINDVDVTMAADSFVRKANLLKKEIGRDKTLPKEMKEAYKHEVELLIEQTRNLRSRSSGSKPATSEAKAVVDLAEQIGHSFQQNQMSSSVTSAWNAMQASLRQLASAFGISNNDITTE